MHTVTTHPTPPRRPLPRTIIILGWISFFGDIGSEMAYPVMPLFLAGTLAAPKVVLGLMEGLAQLVISLSTAWAGIRSDTGGRVGYIRIGYALPSLGRAIIALAGAWPMAVTGRMVDRFGKGLRTSPRDALLADAIDPAERGRAFGYHRGMDNAGAFVGVTLAVVILWWLQSSGALALRWTLGASAVVGLGAVALTLALREQPRATVSAEPKRGGRFSSTYWRGLACLVLFALANSSDAFILLRASTLGLAAWQVALAYAGFSLVLALVSSPLGRLSDRVGRWPVIASGVALYAVTYAGFAFTTNIAAFALLFALYGISVGCTDGVRRALVVDHVPSDARGKGLGIMHASCGVASLVSSVAAGWLWDAYGPGATFILGSALALVTLVAIAVLARPQTPRAITSPSSRPVSTPPH